MVEKKEHQATPGNDIPDSQTELTSEHLYHLKKLQLQHLVLNKLLNSNMKSIKPSTPDNEVNPKRNDQ